MIKNEKKIFIIAGETSGDIHGAVLVRKISGINPNILFYGIGGRNLQENGVELVFNYKEINFIGFASILKNYFRLTNILAATIVEIKEINPSVLILVDFPGFNLRIIKEVRKFYKGTIIYYISPQLWAWHKSRIKIIRKFVDRMLVVFPFEIDFYKKEGVAVDFAGHPLKEKVSDFLKNNTRDTKKKKQITLLPGSRVEEVKKILPIMSNAALKLKDEFDTDLSILCSENIDVKLIQELSNDKSFAIYKKKDENDQINYKVLLNSDLVMTKSGTSTLECCLIGAPFFLVYNTNYLNYLFARFLIKVKFLSIVNILSGKEIVKEFIQKDFNVENLFCEGLKILTNDSYVKIMKNNFAIVKENLFDYEISKSAEEIICEYLK